MTRIVAGTLGGRTLQVPAKGTRPTSERVREALFSRLEHLGVVDDARVLDLFAGSGALGLEAVSRGAAQAVLVDAARAAADVCRKNVRTLGVADRVTVVTERAERYVTRPVATPWDLVLVDPPYDVADDDLTGILAALGPEVAPDGVVVVERSSRTPAPTWPGALTALDTRPYGETHLHLARAEHALGG
ncbi:16S rRNA (guanine(966)-N(2))-methyltransferase RsmD [Cellulomonas hominis]